MSPYLHRFCRLHLLLRYFNPIFLEVDVLGGGSVVLRCKSCFSGCVLCFRTGGTGVSDVWFVYIKNCFSYGTKCIFILIELSMDYIKYCCPWLHSMATSAKCTIGRFIDYFQISLYPTFFLVTNHNSIFSSYFSFLTPLYFL